MSLQNINPSATEAWQQLRNHFYDMQTNSIKDMFANDPKEEKNLLSNGKIF